MTSSTYTPIDDLERLQASAELHAAQDERHIDAAVEYLLNIGHKPPFQVLDVGCGYGTVTQSRFGDDPRFEVIGVDRNREALTIAREQYNARNIEYVQLDADTLPEALSITPDIVFSSYMLHHIEGSETMLHNLWGLVKDPGVLIIRSCDDGQHMHYPESEDVEFIVRNTEWIAGSSNRQHGRRLYTEMKQLSPQPLNVHFDIETYHTAGCDREMREKYWNVFHSNRIHYAKVNAETEANTDEDKSTTAQEMYEYMGRCMDRAYERIVEEDTTFDVKSVPMAVAYKHSAENDSDD